MIAIKDLRKSRETLHKIVDQFRAASDLEGVLAEVEQVVIEAETYDEHAAASKANAEAQAKYLAELKQQVLEALTEKKAADAAVAAIKAQLKALGL